MRQGKQNQEGVKQNSHNFQQSQSEVTQNQVVDNANQESKRQKKDSRPLIRSNQRDILEEHRKDITFYECLLEQQNEDKMCLMLYDISGYENSIPLLMELEHLITFLKLIQKLIQCIHKKQQDVSSQQHLSILRQTVDGFLKLKKLEKAILVKLQKSEKQSFQNQKKMIQNEEWSDFIGLVYYVIDYLNQQQISAFYNIQEYLKITIGFDISIIKQIVEQGNNFSCLYQNLEKIQPNLIDFKPSEDYQIQLIMQLVDFLIAKYKEVKEYSYQQKYENILEECITICLKKEQLPEYLQNLIWSNINDHYQTKNIIKFLQEVVQFKPTKIDPSYMEIYKIILCDFHNEKEESQQIICEYFDQELIQLIEQELKITNKLSNYNKEINLNTNIIPNDDDCREVKNYRGFLKRINLKQTYMARSDYLTNMFNFLRADSHQELVQGMNCAIKLGNKINYEKIKDFDSFQKELSVLKDLNQQFNFYNQIDIINIKFDKGLILTLSVLPILPKKNMKLRIDSSRRLLGDQLLYLTDYKFSKLFICQLENEKIDKNIKSLNQYYNGIRIKIRILEDIQQYDKNIEHIKSHIYDGNAILVEPKIYYGQYVQCMQAIKNMINNQFRLPFQENLLRLGKKVNMPAFINEDTKYYLDFSPLKETEQQDTDQQKYLQQLTGDWSQIPTLKYINQSQAAAIKNILTKEISILQGPPGTGKTYVGAMAVKNILQNSEVWNPNKNVILMCCKTNHALDQFLSHIIKFENDIVRVGGRIKLPEIEEFKLFNQRKKYQLQTQSFYKNQEMENKLNESLKHFSRYIFNCKDFELLIQTLPYNLIKSCCKIFLKNFNQALPFLESAADEILKETSFFKLISKFWWQLNPLIGEMKNGLFYPLIEHYGQNKDDKEVLQHNIDSYLPWFFKQNYDKTVQLCIQYYDQRKNKVNYFYKKSNDDSSDQKINDFQEDSILALWQKVMRFRNTTYMKENFMDDEIDDDDDEYAEDRENYELDDAFNDVEEKNEKEEKDGDQEDLKKIFKQNKNSKQHTSFETLLNLTYYQFMEQDFESKYQELAKCIQSGEIKEISIMNEITIRLKAISQYSSKKKDLFKLVDLKEYQKQIDMLIQEEMLNDVKIMKQKKIVAMTLGGICKYSEYLKHLKYDILLIEEAAEVLENLSVPLLQPFLKQMILIGDHQQLKPNANSYLMEKEYNMNISLFQRLIANNLEYACLNVQMRMAPEFSDYVRLIYNKPNQYQDSIVVQQYDRKFHGFPSNMMFFMHSYEEMNLNYTTTKKNEKEAVLSVDLADYIVKIKQYKPEEITILAMYLGQAVLIKQIIHQYKHLKGIRVQTIDNYQGEENEVIILSLVRSFPNHLGFVKIQNRVNVSISRAKKGFIILGNTKLLATKIPIWQKIFQKAATKNHIFEDTFSVKCPQHQKQLNFSDSNSFYKIINGGCNKPCKQQNLKCQHTCNYRCHYGDCDNFDCMQNVDYVFKCGHEAQVECFKIKNDEAQCKQLITIKNEICGHEFETQCFKYDQEQEQLKLEFYHEFQSKKCQSKCGKKLKCGHSCFETCHPYQEYCNPLSCNEIITQKLGCGHEYQGMCKDLIKHQCQKSVEVFFDECGHQAKIQCFKNKKNEIQCKQLQKIKNQKCGHDIEVECCKLEYENKKIKTASINEFQLKQCEKICGKPLKCKHLCKQKCHPSQITCDQSLCNELITKKSPCGHQYQSKCGDQNKDQCKQLVEVFLDKCGHQVEIECFKNKKNEIECKQIQKIKNQKCGHDIEVECYKLEYENKEIKTKSINQLQQKNCEAICGKPLKCSHLCQQKCHPSLKQCNQASCNQMLKKNLLCGCKYNGKCGDFSKFKCNQNHTKNKLQSSQHTTQKENINLENDQVEDSKTQSSQNTTQNEQSDKKIYIQDQDGYYYIPRIFKSNQNNSKNQIQSSQDTTQKEQIYFDESRYKNQIQSSQCTTQQEQSNLKQSVYDQSKDFYYIPSFYENKKVEQKKKMVKKVQNVLNPEDLSQFPSLQ
ncbi:hypothetical protein ABPG74_017472 [Tetrahymena malaccensis]